MDPEPAASHDEARDEVFRLLGRNVLMFQHLERLLKALLANGQFKGTLDQLKKRFARKGKADKRTLGQLIDPLVDSYLTPFDSSNGELPSTADISISWAVKREPLAENPETFRRELAELVAQRNELIHHSLSRFDLASSDGCRAAGTELERQYDRLRPIALQLRKNHKALAAAATLFQAQLLQHLKSNPEEDDHRRKAGTTLVGVDVGGPVKGFHAVALKDRKLIGKLCSPKADKIADWIRTLDADVIAIDAPCRWREPSGPARSAELQMARVKISSFSTPTQEMAAGNVFYTWMLTGMELYAALALTHPIYDGSSDRSRRCIETFPQAVACALAGQIVSAKQKNSVRRDLLQRCGLAPAEFANIDEVDAALCAVAADAFVQNRFRGYGDPTGGFIVVPADGFS